MIAFILAISIVITPVQSPHIDWDVLSLDQQMALINVWRSEPEPIIMPIQYAPAPLEPTWVRNLVEKYFHVNDVEWALRVSYCESHWDANAKNPTSSASGLFQHLAKYWDERAAKAGWPGASIWDPEANTAVAAWLYYQGGPGHWVCK